MPVAGARRQLGVAIEGLDDAALRRMTIAYEPVWAIGTGVTATVNDDARSNLRCDGLRSRTRMRRVTLSIIDGDNATRSSTGSTPWRGRLGGGRRCCRSWKGSSPGAGAGCPQR